MIPEHVINAPSRRKFFGMAAAVGALALTGAAPLHPDAELMAMAQEAAGLVRDYEASTAAFLAAPEGSPEMYHYADLGDEPSHRLDKMFYRALELPASTVEGFRAKARILQHQLRVMNRMDGEVQFDSPDTELAWSLVCDMVGEG